MTKKLNLGCGYDIRAGWINLDSTPVPGVDIVHDIQKLPLPFKDEEFDYILCRDILEHIEYIPVMQDLFRILKSGAILEVRVPHFSSYWSYIDPTHKKLFSVQTFRFFIKDCYDRRNYYFDFHFEDIISTHIVFEKGIYVYNHVIEKLININRSTQNLYEATLLARLFPAGDIIVKLKK